VNQTEIPEPWKKEEKLQRAKLEKVDTTIGEFTEWTEEDDDVWINEYPEGRDLLIHLKATIT